MRRLPHAGLSTLRRGIPHPRVRRPHGVGPVVLLCLLPAVLATAWVGIAWVGTHSTTASHPSSRAPSPLPGASALATDITRQTRTTPIQFSYTLPGAQTFATGSRFTAYYAAHDGAMLLGQALTAAYPTGGGWVQFFAKGALLQPDGTAAGSSTSAAPDLLAGGVADPATGIVRLPMVISLLRNGSLAPTAGDGSPTYADLRRSVTPIAVVAPDATQAIASPRHDDASQPAFTYAAGGQHHTGRIIAPAIWNFINQQDRFPDGWQATFGLPLTLPEATSVLQSDGTHHLQIEIFARGALVEDDDDHDADGVPTVTPLATGLAFLRTLGAPPVSITGALPAWATADTSLLATPGAGGAPRAHIGLNFPLTVTGDAQWIGNALWYRAHWSNLRSSGDGWVRADALTFAAPAAGAAAWSGFETLSPDLARYLASLGGDTGAVVYDVTRQHYYTYNMNGEYTIASSMKVPILVTFLAMTESQQREPNGDEMALLQAMI
ncbi:MAG: hypothetical protein ACHQ4H_15395, partial [Ktedonobacterales bacterium]